MNSAITFASFICLLWLTGVVLKLPAGTVPITLKVYLLLHLVFVLSGWLGNQQWNWYTHNYVTIYTLSCIPMLAAAMVLTVSAASYEELLPAGVAGLFFCAAIFYICYHKFPGDFQYTLLGLLVGVFISCGITLFLTIVGDQGPEWEKIKITLGAFWLIEGALHYYWGVLLSRGERQKAMELHEYAPGLIAVFLFFYLAWSLSQAHVITSRMPERELQSTHLPRSPKPDSV